MIHSERSLVFETINGKQLQSFMDQWDQILVAKYTPVWEITILYVIILNARKRSGISPFLSKEPEPSDLKTLRNLFFVINLSYYFWLA